MLSRGGNALLSYKLIPRESGGSLVGNRIYHLMSISGDVVEIS